ncbi:MAG: hypothetical protein HC771_13915 [Synechococcales cyanobacterium CRU_2_2]|nr:hypothetical protein [Synechococcales cyanobacterium CRU_2_2]
MLTPMLTARLSGKFFGPCFGHCLVIITALLSGAIAPSQASTYGPLPRLSPSQITPDSCYLRDETGVLIDLNRLCNGSREVVLPSIWVQKTQAADSPDLEIASQTPNARITVKAPQSQAFRCSSGFFLSQCKLPVINITGGQAAEALRSLDKR